MAEEDPQVAAAAAGGDDDDGDHETTPRYKPPAKKSLREIQNFDQDDASLVKYKESLLKAGDVLDGEW